MVPNIISKLFVFIFVSENGHGAVPQGTFFAAEERVSFTFRKLSFSIVSVSRTLSDSFFAVPRWC